MLGDWLMFLAKGVTAAVIITACAGVLITLAAAARKVASTKDEEGHVEFKDLREDADSLRSRVEKALHDNSDEYREEPKKGRKQKKSAPAADAPAQYAPAKAGDEAKEAAASSSEPSSKELKECAKPLKDKALDNERDAEAASRREAIARMRKEGQFCPRNLYVIDYDGDVKGSSNSEFAEEVSAVLEYGTKDDELIVNLRSPGGMVSAYGYASSQLSRIRARGIKLTVCVDEVAASGGYLMAAVADKIIAAPFSYIGSIGVVAEFPNFNRLLEKQGVQYEQVTAGKYKRTLSMLGKSTYEGREKVKGELEAVHRRFKEVVARYRPKVDIDAIATGEWWLGTDAKERGLVDEIGTSDDYIRSRLDATSGSALKILWRKDEKKPILKKALGLLSARTWVKALGDELEEKAARHDGGAIR
ncbi:MAG: protease SohB [Aeromonadales bacterium]|nr:protease SohB [Aeromonadales bacterium]MDY2890243.1 protease SohB [Succinivibrio sp.]